MRMNQFFLFRVPFLFRLKRNEVLSEDGRRAIPVFFLLVAIRWSVEEIGMGRCGAGQDRLLR